MKKGLFFLVLFMLAIFIAPISSLASDNTYLVSVTEETSIHSGASESYPVKTNIPAKAKVFVLGEFTNTEDIVWFNVKYAGVTGWVKNSGLQHVEIKNQYITSSASVAPIRKGALSTYAQAGSLKRGEIVKVLDSFTNGNGEGWVRIQNGSVTGWTPVAAIDLFNGNENYLNETLFAGKDAAIKRSASAGDRTVYIMKKGTSFTVLSSLSTGSETWYRIKDGNRTGWISSKDTAESGSASTSGYMFIKDKTVKVHKGATSSYKVVATLGMGQAVKVTDQFTNGFNEVWNKISYGKSGSGWVLASSLTNKAMKVAYLTVDDGPTIYSSKLLNILDNYNAKATFFMISGRMSTYQEVTKRMVKDGHAVGSHSVTHDKNKFYRSPSSAVNEMVTTRNTIKKVTGVTSNLMRVPYGSIPYMKQSYRNAMVKQNFIMWDWNVDSLDWKYNSVKYVSHTMSQVDKVAKNGGTPYILIHDRKATVDHLPKLLDALQKKGYILLPLTESMTPHQFPVSR